MKLKDRHFNFFFFKKKEATVDATLLGNAGNLHKLQIVALLLIVLSVFIYEKTRKSNSNECE